MAINIKAPSASISASTLSANTQLLPTGNQSHRYVLVTNNSAISGCFVNAGSSSVTATTANICLAPFETRLMERDPVNDQYVAALLISGTATITAVLVGGVD